MGGPFSFVEARYNERMRAFACLIAAILAGPALAQHDGPMPEGRKFAALPANTIIDGVGSSDFPVTTDVPLCRTLVRQGLALLHCFWFAEAVRTMRDAVKADPSCAMAYCGLHIALTIPWNSIGVDKEAEASIARANLRQRNASPEEQALIEAFRLKSVAKEKKEEKWRQAMADAYAQFPNQVEFALIRCAFDVQNNFGDYDGNGKPANVFKPLYALAADVLKKQPRNAGVHHYIIHLYEPGDAAKALASSDLLGQLAPASAHMVHMPGHIYFRVGEYEKARVVLARSKEIGKALAEKLGGVDPGSADWNYGHNNNLESTNLLEMGAIKEARSMYDAKGFGQDWISWRIGAWLAALPANADTLFDKKQLTDPQLCLYGMAQAEAGKVDVAADCLAQVDKRQAKGKPGAVLRAQRDELETAVQMARGDYEKAKVAYASALKNFNQVPYDEPPFYARPPQESYGWMLIRAKRYAEARAAFRDGLAARPKSGWMLYGIANAAELAGDPSAPKLYQEFLAAWPRADADHPYVVHAKSFLSQSRGNR